MVRRPLLSILLALPLAGCAAYEVDAVGAYANASPYGGGGEGAFIDETDGFRVAGSLSRSFVVPGLLRGKGGNGPRLKLAVGSTSASRDLGGVGIGEPAQTAADGDADLWILTPQAGASFRLSAFNWFVEPGVAGGGAYGRLNADYVNDNGVGVNADDTEISYSYRPYLRLGRVGPRLILAVEGGYEQTGLDFDVGTGDDYGSWYVGGVVGLRLTR